MGHAGMRHARGSGCVVVSRRNRPTVGLATGDWRLATGDDLGEAGKQLTVNPGDDGQGDDETWGKL